MKKKVLEQIFNKFFQGNTSNSLGNGLLLSLVKTIIDKLKGTIKVDSIKGTTFTIILPLNIKK